MLIARAKYYLSISVVLLFASSSLAQPKDSLNRENDIRFSMNIERGKLDFFHNIQINTKVFDILQIESSIGLNITKTYFQNTFAPQFSLGFGYDLFTKRKKFKLMPSIKTRATTFNLTENIQVNYLEGLIGYSLVWGDQWFLVQGTYFGRGIENISKSKNINTNYWSYAVHFGVGYNF